MGVEWGEVTWLRSRAWKVCSAFCSLSFSLSKLSRTKLLKRAKRGLVLVVSLSSCLSFLSALFFSSFIAASMEGLPMNFLNSSSLFQSISCCWVSESFSGATETVVVLEEQESVCWSSLREDLLHVSLELKEKERRWVCSGKVLMVFVKERAERVAIGKKRSMSSWVDGWVLVMGCEKVHSHSRSLEKLAFESGRQDKAPQSPLLFSARRVSSDNILPPGLVPKDPNIPFNTPPPNPQIRYF